ncbi:hypothetical protein K470DRAFT_278685 [Piedraia hortae CBS 480.64]|uniref:Uncharacterized protein n=1 Tax=Piedraia hortae CBS 480.64 TaxID=1314780 RepID=A0A6A7BSU3_9PEZI|nr:hypothetical protein K470DRAFT_278685 [Piedraia hortae CBS 480.64]
MAHGVVYFPPLDRCLAGNSRLISWNAAYRALCHVAAAKESAVLEHFLTDDETAERICAPPAKPSAASRSAYDERVAPVHDVESPTGDYDLGQIKQDALWLSKEVAVQEVDALRIVVVAWQTRAVQQLKTECAGGAAVDFSNDDARRGRLLTVWAEECQSLLAIQAALTGRHALHQTAASWIDGLARQVAARGSVDSDMQAIEGCFQELGDAGSRPFIFQTDADFYYTFLFQSLAKRLRMLLAHVHMQRGSGSLSAMVVARWFELMDSLGFLQSFLVPPYLQDLLQAIQALVATISAAMLEPFKIIEKYRRAAVESKAVAYPSLLSVAYFGDNELFRKINHILYRAVQASCVPACLAIFAWALVATAVKDAAAVETAAREHQQRLLGGAESPTDSRQGGEGQMERMWNRFVDPALDEARADPSQFFAKAAVDDLNAYAAISQISITLTTAYGSDMDHATPFMARKLLLSLVRESLALVDYQEVLLLAILDLLEPRLASGLGKGPDSYSLAMQLVHDPVLRVAVLDQTFARYPYELSSLLPICTILAACQRASDATEFDVVQLLDQLKTLTMMVPEHFRSYELENEEDNTNSIRLTSNLPLFIPRQDVFFGQRLQIAENTQEEQIWSSAMMVFVGTPGLVIREEQPMVFQLHHPHSGLEYLGLFLSTCLLGSELKPSPPGALADRQASSGIISLINALLSTTRTGPHPIEEARFILGRFSNALPAESDIVSVIADIFEVELTAHFEQNALMLSLDLAVACADFMSHLTRIFPERAWSILSRSAMINLTNGGFGAIVAGTEVHLGQFRFLEACTTLYVGLVEDAVAGLVQRKSGGAKRESRFESPMGRPVPLVPERMVNTVLGAFTRTVLAVFEMLGTWNFTVPEELQITVCKIESAFELILRYAYGLESPLSTSVECSDKQHMAALLMPSADMIMDALAPADGNSEAMLLSLKNNFAQGLTVADELLRSNYRSSVVKQVQQSCTLLSRVLQTANATGNLQRRFSLAAQLVKQMPVLATLYVLENSWRLELAAFLRDLVLALACTDADPPSLLSGLSPESARAFVAMASQLDRPFSLPANEVVVWEFLAAVLEGRQQWFAMYLLTGALPHARLKDSVNEGAAMRRSLLTQALDELAKIKGLSPRIAIGILKFVAAAQENWIWATTAVRSNEKVISNALDWLERLKAPAKMAEVADATMSARELLMAAHLCDILALNLNASLEVGDKSVLKHLVGKLSFLTNHAAKVDTYNRSLHRTLANNLASKFHDCELADFKRTKANPAPYGVSFYYDLDAASNILGHQKIAWYGQPTQNKDGYRSEFARANANLSMVDAQTHLLGAWSRLAALVAQCIDEDKALQATAIKITKTSLTASADMMPEAPNMELARQTQLRLAFVVLSKLVAAKAQDRAIKDVLPVAWKLVSSSTVDYDVATTAEEMAQYRMLLEILFLALRPYVYLPKDQESTNLELGSATANVLICIVQRVIIPGFRALCANLHSDMSLALPADFALLTALLRTVLLVKGASQVHSDIADTINESNIVRAALSLLSWTDQLAALLDGNSVYGELAINFLFALSNIIPIQESMAVDNVFIDGKTDDTVVVT